VSDEAEAKIAEADAPPIKEITVGNGSNPFKTGGESGIFRHDKKFNNPTGIALLRI
jgi:acetyl-CoA decarbonylase/synthase complex subunit gamma